MLGTLLQLTVVATVGVSATDSLQAIWRKSFPFPMFVEATREHTDAWDQGYRGAAVPDSLMERTRSVVGRWRILVVTDVGCHDALHSVPPLARLAEAVPRIELRLADSRTGMWVMNARRTRDGRAATPTIVVLDGAWNEAGAVVEHPRALLEFLEEHRMRRDDAEFRERVLKWYETDRGVSVIAEIVDMMGH